MTDPETIPLSTDQTAEEIEGLPKPLEPDGSVTFVPPKDNPDEIVNVGPDMVDVDGVEEGDKLETELTTPLSGA
jgi:hypothetical protein